MTTIFTKAMCRWREKKETKKKTDVWRPSTKKKKKKNENLWNYGTVERKWYFTRDLSSLSLFDFTWTCIFVYMKHKGKLLFLTQLTRFVIHCKFFIQLFSPSNSSMNVLFRLWFFLLFFFFLINSLFQLNIAADLIRCNRWLMIIQRDWEKKVHTYI